MMLTTSAIKDFCDQMDNEYKTVTQKFIGDAHSWVRDALSPIYDKWFDEVRSNCLVKKFNLSYLENENKDIVVCLKTLGWHDDTDGNMHRPNFNMNLVLFTIGSGCFRERNGDSFWGSICEMDRNKALKCIVMAKNILKGVENAYDKMFVTPNPTSGKTLFDEFRDIVGKYHDMVVSKNQAMNGSSKDDEIREMFKDNA